MKTPLVLLNLLYQPVRTVVAILGVAFAVLLIFMQMGFYGSAEDTATILFEALDFDLMMISSNYLTSSHPRSFSLTRLNQALEHPDVATAVPLYINWQSWRILDRGPRRAILTLAFRTDERVFRTNKIFNCVPTEECLLRLRRPDTVLMDTATRDYFGPRGVGVRTEMNFKTIEVVGEFTLGTGYNADGMVLTSERTYAYLSGPQALERPAFGLIRLRPQATAEPSRSKNSFAKPSTPTGRIATSRSSAATRSRPPNAHTGWIGPPWASSSSWAFSWR